MAEEDLALDLTGKKKKGKKTKVVLEEGESAEKLPEVTEIREEEIASLELTKLNLVDANSDWPDYSYDELLDMVYDIMREKNPDLAAGKKKTFLMKPPQVARAGSKKTGFSNFAEICRLMKRQPKHVLQFLLAELGTTGSIDGNQCLIVKGRFQQKHLRMSSANTSRNMSLATPVVPLKPN
uniref:Eukaryotic translation initiation factor 2 subunit 2 n=1 Tax=Ditylenchus dipsaci TaxID=166011 RepID=A0A915ELQ0_9BILA